MSLMEYFQRLRRKALLELLTAGFLDSKTNYLSNLLEQEESTLVYVRDEKALDQFFELIGPSDKIGRCEADID